MLPFFYTWTNYCWIWFYCWTGGVLGVPNLSPPSGGSWHLHQLPRALLWIAGFSGFWYYSISPHQSDWEIAQYPTLPETNRSPLKMDASNTSFSLGPGLFSGAFAVSFRECNTSTLSLNRSNIPMAGRKIMTCTVPCRRVEPNLLPIEAREVVQTLPVPMTKNWSE